MNTFIVAFLVIFATWFYRKAIQKDRGVANIPHPKRNFILGNILGITPFNFNSSITEFFEKTGEKIMTLYLFNKPLIFVIDPAIVADTMKDDETYLRQGDALDVFTETIGNVLFAIDGPNWKERRTRLNHSFAASKVRNFWPIISDKTKELLSIIQQDMERHGYIDIDDILIKVTAEIIFKFTMSEDFNILNGDEHQVHHFFTQLRNEGQNFFVNPFHKYTPSWSKFKFILQRRKFYNFLSSKIYERISARKQNPEMEAKDMIDVMIDKNVSVNNIVLELVGITFAGHDTTAHTMAFVLLELSKPENKNIIERLMSEIDQIITSERIEKIEDVNRLEYLSAVIKETLRLNPVAIAHPVQTQKEVKILGHVIPKGSSVYAHYFSMHRLSKYWQDPLVFRPERWVDGIETSVTEDFSSHQTSKIYMPFLSGPHVCIGQFLAQLEMKIILATVLKNYSFSLRSGCTSSAASVITLTPVPTLNLIATKR